MRRRRIAPKKDDHVFRMKRLLDVILSVLGGVVLSPLFLFLALAIKIDSKGPVLFRQRRVGKDKRCFAILKFRTMRTDTPCDVPTHQLKNPDACITGVGRFYAKRVWTRFRSCGTFSLAICRSSARAPRSGIRRI